MAESVRTVINKGDYFMGLAILSAERSKDPNTQVGAVIVNKNDRVIGIGYNGTTNDVKDEDFPWHDRVKKNESVVHAEENAIYNSRPIELKDCTLYTTLYPCDECAKQLIDFGIGEVHYLSDKKADEEEYKEKYKKSRELFAKANICPKHYKPSITEFSLDFSKFQ